MNSNQQTNKNSNQNIKNNAKGRELFYGVIAVASFIILAVGATFAYFTATASSSDSAIGAGSTTLELEYISYGSAWSHNDLIPADTNVSEYSIEYQDDTTATENQKTHQKTNNILCVDDFGNSICSIYEFQVRNNANSPQTVTLNLVSDTNEFANLNAMAYELGIASQDEYDKTDNNNHANDPIFKKNAEDATSGAIEIKKKDEVVYDETPIYVNRKGVKKTLLKYKEDTETQKPSIDRKVVSITEENQNANASDRTVKLADDLTIAGGETKTYIIALYVKNENIDQTKTDAAKSFTGTVIVSTGDGTTGVSGTISASGSQTLQGNQG